MVARPGLIQKKLSHHRFHQLPDHHEHTSQYSHNCHPHDMPPSANDVTIDIPLTDHVPTRSSTGARKGPITEYGAPVGESEGEKPPATTTTRSPNPGRRQRTGQIDDASGRASDDPADGTITRLGRFYQSIMDFSLITRYIIYALPLGIILAIPIIVGATAEPDATIGGVRVYWFFTWLEVVWVSLWTSKLSAHYLPFVFQFVCGMVSSGTRKYALALRALETPIALVFWGIISLLTFFPVCLPFPPLFCYHFLGDGLG